MTRSHRNEDRGGEHRWTFNGVEYPTRKLMCEARRAEYVCLCSISCCGFSHDDFSGLGRACRPRNGLNWMVLVSPPERT